MMDSRHVIVPIFREMVVPFVCSGPIAVYLFLFPVRVDQIRSQCRLASESACPVVAGSLNDCDIENGAVRLHGDLWSGSAAVSETLMDPFDLVVLYHRNDVVHYVPLCASPFSPFFPPCAQPSNDDVLPFQEPAAHLVLQVWPPW
jgi:hypothetical protein